MAPHDDDSSSSDDEMDDQPTQDKVRLRKDEKDSERVGEVVHFLGFKMPGRPHDLPGLIFSFARLIGLGLQIASFIIMLVLWASNGHTKLLLFVNYLLNKSNPECHAELVADGRLADGNPNNDECMDNHEVPAVPSFEIAAVITFAISALFVALSFVSTRLVKIEYTTEMVKPAYWIRAFFQYHDKYFDRAVNKDSAPLFWILSAVTYPGMFAVVPALLGQHHVDQAILFASMIFIFEVCGALIEKFNELPKQERPSYRRDKDARNDAKNMEAGKKAVPDTTRKGSGKAFNGISMLFLLFQLFAFLVLVIEMIFWFAWVIEKNRNGHHPTFVTATFAMCIIYLFFKFIAHILRYIFGRGEARVCCGPVARRGWWEAMHCVLYFSFLFIFEWTLYGLVTGKGFIGMQY